MEDENTDDDLEKTKYDLEEIVRQINETIKVLEEKKKKKKRLKAMYCDLARRKEKKKQNNKKNKGNC